jgi:hypothetical protein
MRVSGMPASSMRMLIATRMSMPVPVRVLVAMIVAVPPAFAINMVVIVRIATHPGYCTRASTRISPFLVVIGHFDTSPVRIN